MKPQEVLKRFNKWYYNHPCSKDTLWHVQNALGDVFDWPEWYQKYIKEFMATKPAEKEEHINTTEGLFKLSKGVKTVREKECENCKIETGKYIRVLGTKCSDCGREITPEPKIEPLNLNVLPFRHCNAAQDMMEDKINELVTYTSSLEKRIKELERR